ncbi:sodium:solute symporter family protein [Gordonia rubripertincta]|uniref:sodium:solute symporter family protein n=1 Tax=Gordonia rubripertincta TaxID=36822 RepID=UPI00117C573B|nr:sodium:solute symporter family protein [Gordonia rubripertincta]TSD93848.1 sodium:solute symporter family protein [Gordonia rubripertincta]
MSLQTVFSILIAVYFVLILVVGLRSNKKISTSSDYSVAGRNMGPVLGTMTFTATYVSALTVIGLVGSANGMGLALVPYTFVGLGCGLLFLVLLSSRVHRAGRTSESVPELLGKRYGDKTVRVTSAGTIVIAYFVYLIAQLFAVGILLSTTIGFKVWAVILVVGTIFVLYTLTGGMQAVARTDAYQLVVLVAAVLLTLVLVVTKVGSDGLSWSDGPGLSQFLGGPVPSAMLAFGWGLSWGLGVACMPNYLQRILSCPDVRTTRLVLGWGSAISFWLVNAPILVIGIGIAIIDPTMTGDSALPSFLLTHGGTIIAALALTGLISAVMSTTDSLLHVMGVYFGRDILCTLRKIDDDATALKLARISTGAIGALAVATATYMSFSPLPLILTFASYAVSLLAAGLFVPLFIGLLWSGASKTGAVASMVVGVIVLIVFEVLRKQGVVELHGIVPTLLCAIIAMIAGSLWDSRRSELTATESDETEQPVAVPTV